MCGMCKMWLMCMCMSMSMSLYVYVYLNVYVCVCMCMCLQVLMCHAMRCHCVSSLYVISNQMILEQEAPISSRTLPSMHLFPFQTPDLAHVVCYKSQTGQVGITTKANGTSPSWNHNYGHRDISQLDAFTASHEGSTLSTFLPHFMGILQLGIWRLSHVVSHLLNHLNNQLLNNRASPKNLTDKSLKKTALLEQHQSGICPMNLLQWSAMRRREDAPSGFPSSESMPSSSSVFAFFRT